MPGRPLVHTPIAPRSRRVYRSATHRKWPIARVGWGTSPYATCPNTHRNVPSLCACVTDPVTFAIAQLFRRNRRRVVVSVGRRISRQRRSRSPIAVSGKGQYRRRPVTGHRFDPLDTDYPRDTIDRDHRRSDQCVRAKNAFIVVQARSIAVNSLFDMTGCVYQCLKGGAFSTLE